MQCAAFLAGMVRSRLVRRAMVLAPKTLLGQWAAELRRCGLGGRVFEYHGNSAADRCKHAGAAQQTGAFTGDCRRCMGPRQPCCRAERVSRSSRGRRQLCSVLAMPG